MANRNRGNRGGRGGGGSRSSGASGGAGGAGGAGGGATTGAGGGDAFNNFGRGYRTRVNVGGQTHYYIPGTESFGVPIGYRRADGSYVTGFRNEAGRQIEFRNDRERMDYEFEARMQAQIHRKREEAAANARKAYLELAGSIAVVREALFVLAKTYEPLISESRAFKDAQRQLAESAAFSGMSFKELTKIQQEAMRSLQLNAKTAADVVSAMSQLSAQAGVAGKTMENVSGLFDLATARGVTLKEAVLGMKQALSGSLEGTPLADKLFMKDLRAVLSDYAQTIGKRTLFDLTQTEKAMAVMKEFERQVSMVSGSYDRFLETTSGKQAVFMERAEAFAASIGHTLDKSFSAAQQVLSSVIDMFLRFDRATGGSASALVSLLAVAGTARMVLFGLVGTLTAVTHSLRSLNIEIGNTSKVIAFFQQRAMLIVGAITALTAALSAFGTSMEQSSITVKEALVPLDEYISKTNSSRTSLDSETAALNENTTALRRNRAERENRSRTKIEVSRGVAADVDLTKRKLMSSEYTTEDRVKAFGDLIESIASDSGMLEGGVSLITGGIKSLLGFEESLTKEELSAFSAARLFGSVRKKLSQYGVRFDYTQPLRSNRVAFDTMIERFRETMGKQGFSETLINQFIEQALKQSLDEEMESQRSVVGQEQEKLRQLEKETMKEQKVKPKEKLEKPIMRDGKVYVPATMIQKSGGKLYILTPPNYSSSSDAGGGGGGNRVSDQYEGAIEMSVSEFLDKYRHTLRAVDGDTYEFNALGMSISGRLVGIDAFEIIPSGGQTERELSKAKEQAASIFNFDYANDMDKIQPGTKQAAALALSRRLGAGTPQELLSMMLRNENFKKQVNLLKRRGLSQLEAEQVALIDVLGREQMKISQDILSKGSVEGLSIYGTDSYGRSLMNIRVGEDPLAGLLLRTGMFEYMGGFVQRDPTKKPTDEEQQRNEFVQSVKSYLPNRVRGGRVRSLGSMRAARTFLPEDFDVEMLRLESQDERFQRDNVPEALRSIVQDLNYQTGYVSSMSRVRERAERRVESRLKEVEDLKRKLEVSEKSGKSVESEVLRQEIQSAEQAFAITLESFNRLSSRIQEQTETVNRLTEMKILRAIGELSRSGAMRRQEVGLAVQQSFGATITGFDRGIVSSSNEELAQAFEYMMSLPEQDRERIRPAFDAYVGLVRSGRMAQLSQAALSVFQGGNIMGAGDMSTRGLALAGALSQSFGQASARFVSGALSAMVGGRELDSRAVFELKEIEYYKQREQLLQADFENEKERRLRLQILEEERAEYLESQVDTFGSRLRVVFSETADFAGQVFNQVLTQLLVSSLTQGAGRSLLSLGLSLIPGGSAIAGFLGLSSGGYMPGGSFAIVGDNPDGTMNRTSELVASKGVSRVFSNMQTNRIVSQIGRLSSQTEDYRVVRSQEQQVRLLGDILRETKRAMVMTDEGGDVLAKRSEDYISYRERFIQKY